MRVCTVVQSSIGNQGFLDSRGRVRSSILVSSFGGGLDNPGSLVGKPALPRDIWELGLSGLPLTPA